MQREAIFIDGSYLEKVAKEQSQINKIYYPTLINSIRSPDHGLLRAYYYHCLPYMSPRPTPLEISREKQVSKFFDALSKFNFIEVKLGRLQKIGNQFKQKGVDVQLSVDLVRLSWGRHIQKAILVAGDFDFTPAVQAAKDAGVFVKLVYSKNSVHDELLKKCDETWFMTETFLEKASHRRAQTTKG